MQMPRFRGLLPSFRPGLSAQDRAEESRFGPRCHSVPTSAKPAERADDTLSGRRCMGLFMACGLAGHRARSGSKGVCPARSSSALLAGITRRGRRTSGRDHRDGPAQALGDDRGRGQACAAAGGCTDKAAMPRCWPRAGSSATGPGRSRAATASASTSRTAWCTTARWYCHVPPKLSAQVRVSATGNGRKTDPVDAHSVAMVALRSPGLVRRPGRRPSGGHGDARGPAGRAGPRPRPRP